MESSIARLSRLLEEQSALAERIGEFERSVSVCVFLPRFVLWLYRFWPGYLG